ncbi:hypothetical protein F4801DRAFT_541562 [Xylaria longipes]|nr:hypothetical protein F4801DRAFT_541562 [Xylaria longipes]
MGSWSRSKLSGEPSRIDSSQGVVLLRKLHSFILLGLFFSIFEMMTRCSLSGRSTPLRGRRAASRVFGVGGFEPVACVLVALCRVGFLDRSRHLDTFSRNLNGSRCLLVEME